MHFAFVLLFLLPLFSPFARGQIRSNIAELVPLLQTRIQEYYPQLEELYFDLHRHPELSFHESNTARKLAGVLAGLGYDVTTNVGGHGIVGVLRNGEGRTILVRTDLDALPVQEQTGLPYASTAKTRDDQGNEVSTMHACGHDIHMTVFAGVARLLSELREHWQGTLVMIGQPAEERGKGARAMLQDGLFRRFPKPDACLALHVSADLPTGTIGLTPGLAMANVDSVEVLVRGVGGHGAFPHKTKDPIVLAAQIILALQTIVSREVEPIEPAVVTVGSIHGGTKHNIIPAQVQLQLTVRSFTDQVRAQTLAAIPRITRGLGLSAGLPEELLPVVTVSDEHTPALNNNRALTRRLDQLFRSLPMIKQVVEGQPVMGGEDFGQFGRTSEAIPICMFSLGSVPLGRVQESQASNQSLPSLHSPFYAPEPKPTIQTGIGAMTTAVLEILAEK